LRPPPPPSNTATRGTPFQHKTKSKIFYLKKTNTTPARIKSLITAKTKMIMRNFKKKIMPNK
ncbi:hypothetical protein, partial [Enterobacter asburiae]